MTAVQWSSLPSSLHPQWLRRGATGPAQEEGPVPGLIGQNLPEGGAEALPTDVRPSQNSAHLPQLQKLETRRSRVDPSCPLGAAGTPVRSIDVQRLLLPFDVKLSVRSLKVLFEFID
eukprot:m.387616 g.387616  ORF g.387616 m.387616 type:complete len:117 (+) comp16751_c1_seq24:4481-4831(+)